LNAHLVLGEGMTGTGQLADGLLIAGDYSPGLDQLLRWRN
jgi:hypothetical protein